MRGLCSALLPGACGRARRIGRGTRVSIHRTAVELEIYDFRNAVALLRQSHAAAWGELVGELTAISQDDVVTVHRAMATSARDRGSDEPAGGQRVTNKLIAGRLTARGWITEPPLYRGGDQRGHELAGWKMDFLKDRVGVEVSFNHAEAVPWTFTRLNLAAESDEVLASSRIEVGVAVFATRAFKSMTRMDPAVGTYEKACLWLEKMRPIMPTPIAVVGLSPVSDDRAWQLAEGTFRGTIKRGGKSRPLPARET